MLVHIELGEPVYTALAEPTIIQPKLNKVCVFAGLEVARYRMQCFSHFHVLIPIPIPVLSHG